MAQSLFDKSINASDRDYITLVRHPTKFKSERAFVDSLWQKYAPFADKHFQTECGKAFLQRYWEMYLTMSLEKQGFGIESKDHGPDVRISKDEHVCWVEAIAATAGSGPDAVPEMKHDGTAWRVPNEQIILRLTSAFVEKFGKYEKYLAKNIVGPNDPFVIAINGRGIPFWQVCPNLPRIVSAVLPFGSQYVTINKKTLKAVDSGFQHRPEIPKQSGSMVPTTAFEGPRFAGISAVLYSSASVWSRPLELGHLTYLIHNPHAKNPIPRGFIKVATEYWAAGGKLKGITSSKVNPA